MMQRIDAIDKGIVPSSFDYRTETGDRGVKDGIGVYTMKEVDITIEMELTLMAHEKHHHL